MPKKKPIAKRLNKLFKDIQQEEPNAKEKERASKSAPVDAASPVVEARPTVKRPRPSGSTKTITQTENFLALAFQTSPNDWATLQVYDEAAGRKWSDNDQTLIQQVTDQLSLALENARLFQETQSRAEDLNILNQMAGELTSLLNEDAIGDTIFKYGSRLMDMTNLTVGLYNEANQEFNPYYYIRDGKRITESPYKLEHGLAAYMFSTKKPLLLPDNAEERARNLGITPISPSALEPSAPSIRQCWMGTPLIIGNTNIGAIFLQSRTTPNLYSERHLELLGAIAGQAAIALQNTRLFQESQRRAQEMSALAEVGREISATLELKAVLEKIAEYAIILLDSISSAVYLPDPEFKKMIPFAVMGDEAEEIRHDPLEIGEGILGNIVLSKAGEIINNVYQDERAITIQGTTGNVENEHLMAVPIMLQDRVTGLMAIWRVGKDTEYKETEFNFLANLAQQAAIAIENASLFQDVTNSQIQLSEALRIARIGYFEIDLSENAITFTDELFSLLNTTAAKEGGYTLPFQHVLDKFVIPEDIPIAMKTVEDAIASNDNRSDITSEVRYITSDSRIIWVSSTYKVEHDNTGQPLKIAGSSQDITERKTNELVQAAITNISESALTSSTTEELFKTVHESIHTILPARNFYAAIYNRDTNMISFPYHVDEVDDDWAPRKLGKGLTAHIIRSGKPLRTTPEIFSDLEASGEIVSDGAHSIDWLGVPLRSGGVIRGVIAIQTYEDSIRITDNHAEIFTVIGAQTAAALERLLAREELAKSEADLRALFSAMEDVILVYDKEGRYVRVAPTNPSRLFLPPEDMIGKKIIDIMPPDLHKLFMNAITSTLSSGETTKIEYPLTVNNQQYWFDATLSKLNEDQVFWVARDITERKHGEEILQRRNAYLAASSEIGRLVTSTLDLNTIFTRTVNLMSDRLGFYFAAIYQIDEEGYHAIMREGTGGAGESMKIQKHRVSVGSQTMIGKAADAGKAILANDVSNEPLYQPNPLLLDTRSEAAIPLKVGGRILGVIDIQSKAPEAFTSDVLSVLQSLADQVAVAINNAKLYDESQELIKTLKEVDQLKSQFLANMSHELRTPLNSIIGFSRVILKGIDGPITEMQNQDLTAIYNSGQHLLGLINDILDLARIEAGKMELNFEEVHLSEMVHSVFSTAKGLVKEKAIKLIEQVPTDMPSVRGDTMRVRQVLLNLISNASKFTDEGSITVETKIQSSPTGKLEALVNVIDTGAGISQEGQEKLFKAFSQVDGSATRKSGGSGLGLSICANLVQLHGGRIGVTSQEGIGSTFWFTIPLFHQPVEQIPTDMKVILAIDDDPRVINLYKRYLAPQGYHVVPLTDPAKARELVKELKPFAVTLDIMMPHVDGWTVLTDIKSDPATRNVPIIICSIVEQPDKGFNLGAADYLVKPILEEEIIHALDRLNKHGAINNVLIIDDDPNDLRLIEKILKEHSRYKAFLAEGGRKGWEAIIAKPPDAIILDIFMPEMDGFTILEKLREDPRLRNIPVLVVSGGGLTVEQQNQLTDYGQRMITKSSLTEDNFITSIENALKRIGD